MKFKLALFFLVLILAVTLAGCGGGGGSAYDDFKGDNGGGESWTVMVFLNADNDLERFSIDNVNQMEKIGSSDRLKIVVQWDRTPGYSTADGDWSGTRRYEITKDNNTGAVGSRMVDDMGEVDMGDPQAMIEFIAWAQANYPADKYCLVVWNHGSGWRSANLNPCYQTKNISFDDTSNTSIRTRDLPAILRSAPQPIDLLAMDASLMQMMEVAYEIKGTVGYMVGSEESPPGDGYIYDRWLGPLAANPGMSPASLGKVIVDNYIQAYSGSYPVTQSVIDLSKVGTLGLAVDQFASALLPFASSRAGVLRDVRDAAQHYSPQYNYNYADLLDYAGRVSSTLADSSVSTAYSNLSSAFKNAVIYEGHTGTEMANSHGLSIWVPDPAAFSMDSTRYQSLLLSQDTNWDDFLAAQEL